MFTKTNQIHKEYIKANKICVFIAETLLLLFLIQK